MDVAINKRCTTIWFTQLLFALCTLSVRFGLYPKVNRKWARQKKTTLLACKLILKIVLVYFSSERTSCSCPNQMNLFFCCILCIVVHSVSSVNCNFAFVKEEQKFIYEFRCKEVKALVSTKIWFHILQFLGSLLYGILCGENCWELWKIKSVETWFHFKHTSRKQSKIVKFVWSFISFFFFVFHLLFGVL